MRTEGRSGFLMRRCAKGALFLLGAFLLFAVGGTSAARAQDVESACRNDAYRLCSQYIPNEGAVKGCMRRNVRRLSPVCRAGFTQGARRTRRHVRHPRHYRKPYQHRRHHYRKHRRHR